MKESNQTVTIRNKELASPYLVWMVAFIAAPLCIVVYFAFTDKAGAFTLANIMGLGQYTTVFTQLGARTMTGMSRGGKDGDAADRGHARADRGDGAREGISRETSP